MDDHELYMNYLEEWQLNHADPVFDGMTPASFQEWLDNDKEYL